MRRILTIVALAACAPAAPAGAQGGPVLPRGADPNDWHSYFALGESLVHRQPAQAQAAFEWASRLDPTRAEPLLGRWASFHARDLGSWLGYLERDAAYLRRPQVMRNDSLYRRAFVRDPLANRGLEAALFAMLGHRLRPRDALTAFTYYAEGSFPQAARVFGRVARGGPGWSLRARHFRALSWVGAGQADSAIAEIQGLLDALRAREPRESGDFYQSAAAWEHALGMLHESRGDTAQARRAFQRALEEDRAWYPAGMGLARLALQAGNSADAVEHLARAAQAAPGDGVVRYEHGSALYAAGRVDQAAAEYRAAMELEPFWADVPLRLGMAYDRLGQPQRAAAMYRAYLQRAPQRQAETIDRIRQRLAAIEPGR